MLHAEGSAFIVVCAAGYKWSGECTKAGVYIERAQTCCEHRSAAASLWLGLDLGDRQYIHHHICTTCIQHSNKDTGWTQPHNRHHIYLYTETWWQCWTCSSHGKKKNKTGQWEREEEQPRYPFMFMAESLPPRVRPATSGPSCRKLVHIKAQESQGSGREPWTHMNQTTFVLRVYILNSRHGS